MKILFFKKKICLDNQKEANEKVDRKRRYRQILSVMEEINEPMTAKQIALCMYNRGMSYTDDRNISSPRLTELENENKVEVVGKTKCEHSGKTVSLYKICENRKEENNVSNKYSKYL